MQPISSFTPWAWRDPAWFAGGFPPVEDERAAQSRTPNSNLTETDTPATEIDTPAADRRANADLTGYRVEATDGRIGSVDEASYEVGMSFLVVDTGPWIFGRKVLLPAGTVQRIDHDDRVVYVDRTKDQVKDSPEYDKETFATSEYRERVGGYYRDSYRDSPMAG